MKHSYKTSGTCSRGIEIEYEDGIIKNVSFDGGCGGNTQGISTLVKGMCIDDVISKFDGLNCGFRGTSCPDQLARALKEIAEQ